MNYIAKDPILLHVFVFNPWVLVCHVIDSSQEECDVCFSVWGKQEKLAEDIYQIFTKCLPESYNLDIFLG